MLDKKCKLTQDHFISAVKDKRVFVQTLSFLKAQLGIIKRDRSDFTLLHHAAEAGRLNVVEWLLAQGLPINEKSSFGTTALDLAIFRGHREVGVHLMRQGAKSTMRPPSHWL